MLSSRFTRSLAGCILAAAVCILSLAVTAQASGTRASTPTWARYNATKKTAHLIVISAYGADTYNFNGGSNGAFTFTVPVGSKVDITYSNDSAMMPHGFEIVKWTGTLPEGTTPPKPAFKGSASPNYRHGIMQGIVQKFSFTADKAGKYLMICPVHNHVKFGHWGWFIVSKKAKTATGVLKPSS